MVSDSDDEIFGDVKEPGDNYNAGEHTFSHQSLVMLAIKKCLENGSVELREGWWDEKTDRSGNTIRVYHVDTRKAFIESVKSLMMITKYDFEDDEGKGWEQVEKLVKQIKDRKKYWLEQEWLWWSNLTNPQKEQMSKQGKSVIQGCFNSKLNFDNYFFDEETDLYREICTEINNMAGRRDWYDTEDYMN